MKKLVILMLTLCNAAFAQGNSKNGGSLDELQTHYVQISLQNFAANIANEDFKKTMNAAIQSFNIELRSNPELYKDIAKTKTADSLKKNLISVSEDKKDLVVLSELYQEAPAISFATLVVVILKTHLERSLTDSETQEILNTLPRAAAAK